MEHIGKLMTLLNKLGSALFLLVCASTVWFISPARSSTAHLQTLPHVEQVGRSTTWPLTDTIAVYLPLIMAKRDCFLWSGQIPLQRAVDQYPCVEIQTGIWTTTAQISLQPGHMLIGKDRNSSILRAVDPWIGNGTPNGAEAVVHDNGSTGVTVANFTIDANNRSAFGLGAHGISTTVQSMNVINAKCDGIAVAGPGWKIRYSTIENNGKQCPTGVPGSGIYVIKQPNSTSLYSPTIEGNIIRDNGGPGLDVDRVWGGTFRNNLVSDNQAWTAISLYSASYWVIENNTVSHPSSADPIHPGHGYCTGGPFGNHPAALSICKDGQETEAALHNIVRNNQMSGWYGILLIGEDENHPLWIPRLNIIEGNNVSGSQVGCADDFEPSVNIVELNTWANNNCAGTPDSLPLYFDVLCPSAVRRSAVEEWHIGETSVSTVNAYIDLFNRERSGGGDFVTGDQITAGVVVATNYEEAGHTFNEFPVTPLVHNRSYGLFETTGQYTAPYPGACLTIVPE